MPDIEIKRGYEVLPDNNIRFGIRITNNTDSAISDVEVILDYTESLFNLEGEKIQKLGNIPPTIPRTAKFILKPLGCIHKENIEATIQYRDHKWEKHLVKMRPKNVHCVCPFLKEKTMTKAEFLNLSNTGHSAETGLNFQGISIGQLTSFLIETCKNRLYKLDEYSIESGKILYLASESVGEKAHYLLTAYIKENEGLTQVMLRAVSDKPHGLNGFLNEIVDNLRHVVSTVQSAQEIGVIKKEQVINIIDSVVQRTTFAGEGGEGAASVNIEGSVVQRTEFKGDDGQKRLEEERLRREREKEERARKEREEQERVAGQRESIQVVKKNNGSNFTKYLAVILIIGVLGVMGYWFMNPGSTDTPETMESSPLPTPKVGLTVSPTPTITPAAITAQPTVSISSETATYSTISIPVNNLPDGYEYLGSFPISDYNELSENIIESIEGAYRDRDNFDVFLDIIKLDSESAAIEFILNYNAQYEQLPTGDRFTTFLLNGQGGTIIKTYRFTDGNQVPKYQIIWNHRNIVVIVRSNSNLENSAFDLATVVMEASPTSTATVEQTATSTATIGPQEYLIRIDNYMFIPEGDKEINIGDTVKWRNFEDSKQARYLVNENGIWDGSQFLTYMQYTGYTFNEPGIYTFYLQGRESKKMNIKVV